MGLGDQALRDQTIRHLGLMTNPYSLIDEEL